MAFLQRKNEPARSRVTKKDVRAGCPQSVRCCSKDKLLLAKLMKRGHRFGKITEKDRHLNERKAENFDAREKDPTYLGDARAGFKTKKEDRTDTGN